MSDDEGGLSIVFNVNRICDAEAITGQSVFGILQEMQSEQGLKLTTLRSLLAAGSGDREVEAGARLLEEHGVEICAEAVGKAMAAFIASITRSREDA